MKIEIENKHKEQLSKYTDYIKLALKGLSRQYKFSMPDKLTLRSLRTRQRKRLIALTFATAGFDETIGYYISLNLSCFERKGTFEKEMIAHEVAHIAEALHAGKWSHSKLHDKMTEEAEKYIRTCKVKNLFVSDRLEMRNMGCER